MLHPAGCICGNHWNKESGEILSGRHDHLYRRDLGNVLKVGDTRVESSTVINNTIDNIINIILSKETLRGISSPLCQAYDLR